MIAACEIANRDPDVISIERELDLLNDEIVEPRAVANQLRGKTSSGSPRDKLIATISPEELALVEEALRNVQEL